MAAIMGRSCVVHTYKANRKQITKVNKLCLCGGQKREYLTIDKYSENLWRTWLLYYACRDS